MVRSISELLNALPDERTRVAVSCAILIARNHLDEVTSWYGTYGTECLQELIKLIPAK